MKQDSVIIRCNKCSTKNRVPRNRLDDKPVCGKCHELLPKALIFDHPVTVTDESFKKEVLNFTGPVLVDFWAPWCGPCKMMTPVLDDLAKTFAGRLKIAKLNIDENQMTASQFMVQSVPTLMFFKNGKQVNTLIGAQPKNAIERQIQAML